MFVLVVIVSVILQIISSEAVAKGSILNYFNTKELPDRTVCGLEKESRRIVGGTITEIDEFPWMVALEYQSKFTGENVGIRCGGSLINNRFVLTAVHCIRDREFQLFRVRLGEWKISTDPDCEHFPGALSVCAENVKMIEIQKNIPHPFYSKRTGNNDIALLRLEEDIEFTDYIRPICLPPSNLSPPALGTKLTVAGWGATENGTASDLKLKIEVPLISNGVCAEKLEDFSVNTNQLCAGTEKGRDSCHGDSGGPLMRTYEDTVHSQLQWYQEGVVSRGLSCGSAKYPAVYTRVKRYINWIINIINED